jgi:Family of unknown function (DUF5519)
VPLEACSLLLLSRDQFHIRPADDTLPGDWVRPLGIAPPTPPQPNKKLFAALLAESVAHSQASKRSESEMINYVRKVEETVSNWPGVSVGPHRFDGREFVFGSSEIGLMHTGGIVIYSVSPLNSDVLLAEGFAEEHRWVPNSFTVSCRRRSAKWKT